MEIENYSKKKDYNLRDRLNDIINNKTNSEKMFKDAYTTKNSVFLSLPKINANKKRINKTFINSVKLNFSNSQNKPNKKLRNSLFKDNTIKTEHNQTTSRINKIRKNFNNTTNLNDKNFGNNYTNGVKNLTLFFDNTYRDKNNERRYLTKFNTTYKHLRDNNNIYKNRIKKIQKTKPPSPSVFKRHKLFNKKQLKAEKPNLNKKDVSKDSFDYLKQIYNNNLFQDNSNLKKLNLGDLMKKEFKQNNNLCLLNDNNKMKGEEESNQNFKIGEKYFSEEKAKNLEKKYEYKSKLKMLYDKEREKKIRKKINSMRNCHEVLEYYKNNRMINFRKLIQGTLDDAKKARNIVQDFFADFQDIFDEYDNWNDPKNRDNLYD